MNKQSRIKGITKKLDKFISSFEENKGCTPNHIMLSREDYDKYVEHEKDNCYQGIKLQRYQG